MIPRAAQKEAATLPTRAYWAFWKMAIPPAFRWYKDLYRRGGQYRLFRMPSPASEDPHESHHDLNHHRTPYLHSEHNVRRDTILNSDRHNTAFVAVVDLNLPLGEKLVKLGFLKPEDSKDEQKVAKAAEKFRTNYGEDPQKVWRFSNHPGAKLDFASLGDKNASAEDKRKAMRTMFQSSSTRLAEHREDLIMGNLDDIYRPHFHTLRGWFNNWDHGNDSPHYRQARIDQIILYEDKVAEYKAARKVKVYKGNPRAQWQVLDESFDDTNRLAAQAAVKDSRAVAFGLPNQKGVSLSQKRRSSLVVEEDHETESYRSLPYASQHI